METYDMEKRLRCEASVRFQRNLRVYCADKNAVLPTYGSEQAVGMDLTVISLEKKLGENTSLFDTGLVVYPPEGYYTEIVPRSSISKSGYVLANSVGIIDPDYTGSLKIALTKVDPSKPDLVLPCKICQIILRKIEKFHVQELAFPPPETKRGSGGFGSTDCANHLYITRDNGIGTSNDLVVVMTQSVSDDSRTNYDVNHENRKA